jgi:serine/threonine protein kinase
VSILLRSDRYDTSNNSIDKPTNSREGTKRYLSPEVLNDTLNTQHFDSFKRADVYALGLVLWELAARTVFFGIACKPYNSPYHEFVASDPSIEEMRQVVVVQERRPTLCNRWQTDPLMRRFSELMRECWYQNPAARLPVLKVKKSIAALEVLLKEQYKPN